MRTKNTYDKLLLLTTLLLIGFGALMVYSSTSVVTPVFARRNISQFFYFKRHLFTLLIGIVVLYLGSRASVQTFRKIAVPLLIFSLILLILVFVPKIGITAGGARRWIRLWPSTFQPSELVKLAMVLFLAKYMSGPTYRTDNIYSFVVPIGIMVGFQGVFLKQPDFGATMSLGLITFAMLTVSGMRLRYLMMPSVLVIPVLIYLLKEPYRLKRIVSFLDPWKDPQGSGFQLVQSFIALGSGGLSGVGLGESKQKLSFLPESHTDFIFSLVGEELGFIGASILVALFCFLFIRGIQIANRAKDPFVHYLASGLSMMIALQALINFFVATGLAPTKGLPLPFVSYGGSALLVNMAAIGILLNLSRGEEEREIVDKNKILIEKKKALMAVYGRSRPFRDGRAFSGVGRSPR
ncbi:MAG TPA: putative lipid II flippase FtsW [Thermodesulfovibrionales bacterium]|jgi:cell division protein FtsW|nr:putative lipid II flippase FtsW [Thermodesulfovibrionales bacterium]